MTVQQKYVWLIAGMVIGYLFLGSVLGGVSGLLSGARKSD